MRITELSVRLLTATHRERLAIGRSGPMTVVLADNSRRVLTVRALRSQFVQAEGQMGYITVFSVEEGSGDAAGQLVNELIASGRAQTA